VDRVDPCEAVRLLKIERHGERLYLAQTVVKQNKKKKKAKCANCKRIDFDRDRGTTLNVFPISPCVQLHALLDYVNPRKL